MPLASLDSTSDLVFLFAGAGLVLYIAARAAVDALTSASDPSPGKLAVGHWISIAWPALLATAAGRSEIGVAIALATSVAALAMVMGVLICISGDTGGARLRARAWPFVVPAALLALLAGFSGSLTWWHALMLLGLGACVLSVWNGRDPDDEPALAAQPPTHSVEPPGGFEVLPPSAHAQPHDQAVASAPPSPPSSATPPVMTEGQWRAAQLVLAVALAAAGGWLAYRATTVADDRTRVATSGLIAAAVVAPLLVLPMLGTGAIAAHHGRLPAATAAIVGVVLLNLCLLLPLVVLTHHARQVVVDWERIQPVLDSSAATTTTATTTETAEDEDIYQIRPMPFPLAVWRVDTVLLIVLGLLLVPVSLGRLTLKKPEGLALAVIYAVYLVISTALAIRM